MSSPTTVSDAPWFTVEVTSPPEETIARVTEALADEGFGVLTRIDLHKAFEEKLGVAFRPYVILGACNPALAHEALSQVPELGLLLPCNVTVEEGENGGSTVRMVDPKTVLGGIETAGSEALEPTAHEARRRIRRVAEALGVVS